MKITTMTIFLWAMALPWVTTAQADATPEPLGNVVLLHGLARSSGSMSYLARKLNAAGYHTCNVSYPSRKHTVEELAANYVLPAISECFEDQTRPVDFVTHSLGGIIVRQLERARAPLKFGRVVMLAPPNRGSKVVDRLGRWWLFGVINGPAGKQLGTSDTDLPKRLGPAHFELGVIAGRRSINLILSTMIPGKDDGKVSIQNAKLDGMADFLVVPVSHPFIMNNEEVASQVLHFLGHGVFWKSSA